MQYLRIISAIGLATIALLTFSCKDKEAPPEEASPTEDTSAAETLANDAPAIAVEKAKESESIVDILRKPENLQEFAYADFGSPLLTANLGKPLPYNGVAEKLDGDWPVGNIRVLVTAHSYVSAQMLFLQKAGRLDPALDYRIIWYFGAMMMIEDILEDPKVPEEQKIKPREMREKLIAKMGSEDEVRSRMSKYREPLNDYVYKNNMYADIKDMGRSIMAKGQSQ
jgi:hypothetical protein